MYSTTYVKFILINLITKVEYYNKICYNNNNTFTC